MLKHINFILLNKSYKIGGNNIEIYLILYCFALLSYFEIWWDNWLTGYSKSLTFSIILALLKVDKLDL